MSLRKAYQTDLDLETDGIEYEPVEGVIIKIARAGGANKKYERVMESLTQPHRRKIQRDDLDPEVAMSIAQKAFARAVVLDWSGVTYDDLGDDRGEVTAPYSPTNCELLFKQLPDIFTEIREIANNAVMFRRKELEEDAGN